MATPYNLDVQHSCSECVMRAERPFCDMSPQAVAALDSLKFTSVYPKGALLFVEGEQARGVFVLCSGRAKLSTTSTDGRTVIVKIAEAGEILGASATILGNSHEVSAETLEPSQLNFVRGADFLRLLRSHGEASLNVARQLSEKYQSAHREIRSLGLSRTVAEKLAKLLLNWCTQHGEQTSLGVRLKVLLTHEEIAQMVGSTRETITRLLSDFRRHKIIEVKGSTMLVTQKNDLERMVSI